MNRINVKDALTEDEVALLKDALYDMKYDLETQLEEGHEEIKLYRNLEPDLTTREIAQEAIELIDSILKKLKLID